MNGLAITIIVGQLPKLCGFSTDADGFVDEVRAFVTGFDERNATALVLGLVTLAVLLVLPRLTRTDPGRAGRGRRRHRGDGAVRPRRRDGRRPPAGPAPARAAVDRRQRRRTDARGRDRHHAGVADRHDRHVDQLRRPPGRRGRPEPGDDRHRDGERRRRVLPGLRGVHQRLAHRGGRAVRRQEPAHRPGRRRPRRPAPALLQLPARRPPADGAGRRRDRGRALAGRSRHAPSLPGRSARRRSCSRWSPPAASCSSACSKAS